MDRMDRINTEKQKPTGKSRLARGASFELPKGILQRKIKYACSKRVGPLDSL
jgi:hypothetical protein